ncbi:MAG: hypothetical protein M0R03_13475 [Novosphingobium sp.]|nr:hypothetical protein [Novosphingobium sp.]
MEINDGNIKNQKLMQETYGLLNLGKSNNSKQDKLFKKIDIAVNTSMPTSCTHCDFSTTEPSILNGHRYMKHFIIPTYACNSQCCNGVSNNSRYYIIKHFKTYHKEIKLDEKQLLYKCYIPNCKFTTSHGQSLASHIKKIHTKNIYNCDLCLMSYNSIKKLNYHMKHQHPESQ